MPNVNIPQIKKVFVLMLENRSFDHMLGFAGLTGLDAVTGKQRAINGLIDKQVFNNDPRGQQPHPVFASADAPYSLTEADLGYEFSDVLEQLCGRGAMVDPNTGSFPKITNSGFVSNYVQKQPATSSIPVMQAFGKGRLPVLESLAREFAVCDAWYSSLPGPTWPNRFFFHAASSSGMIESPASWSILKSNLFLGYTFQNGTVFDLLDTARIPWCIYEGDEFPQAFAIRGMAKQWIFHDAFRDFSRFAAEVSKPDFKPQYIFIEPNYGRDILPPQDFIGGNSQHPLDNVLSGEQLIRTVYETIRNSPHWPYSLFLITYDEHGGFYDHDIPPATAVPPGDVPTVPDQPTFDFRQYGVRVPSVIISPFTARNLIDSTPYDHTSFLRTLELLFDLPSLTNRDRQAHSFLHLLRSASSPRTVAPISSAPSELSAPIEMVGRPIETIPEYPSIANFDSRGPVSLQPHHYDWLHVAFLREQAIQQYEQPGELSLDQSRRDLLEIRTISDARRYMSKVRERVKGFKQRLHLLR
jgi:phospholipase C